MTTAASEESDFISRKELAKKLRCSLRKVDRMISSEEIESVRIGRQRWVTHEQFAAFKARLLNPQRFKPLRDVSRTKSRAAAT